MSLYTLRKCFEAITTPNCYTICETSLKPLKKLPLKSCMFSLLNVSTFGGLYIYLSSLKKIIIRSYRYIFEKTLKFKMEFFKLEKLFTQQPLTPLVLLLIQELVKVGQNFYKFFFVCGVEDFKGLYLIFIYSVDASMQLVFSVFHLFSHKSTLKKISSPAADNI